MHRFLQYYSLGSWELHVDVSKGFPKSGLFGRGCGEGLSLISTTLTYVNPGAGDKADPVPCQCRGPLKQLQVPPYITKTEPNVSL